MQVYVTSLNQDSDSPVVAWYEEHTIVGTQPGLNESHPGAILLCGIDRKYIDAHRLPVVLKKEWREAMPQVVAAESAKRIEDAFPAATQSAASLQIQANTLSYGSDVSQWPASAQTSMKEIKRGLDYITSVHAAENAIVSQGVASPTDDANWPAPIEPVKL
jgi:hypothetical protein